MTSRANRKRFSDYCRQSGVGWLKSTNLQFSRCYIFVNNVHYDNSPFWISDDTNKNDLECPIRLKVRLADGTLDVRMLWRSEQTTRE